MITIDAHLMTTMLAASSLTALRGNRLYQLKLPQNGQLPAQTYREVSAPRDYTHSGQVDLLTSRYQITSWAPTLTAARALARATRLALVPLRDSGGGLRASFKLVNEMDIDEPDSATPGVAQDYLIEHREDI